jgi:hypothetical protein
MSINENELEDESNDLEDEENQLTLNEILAQVLLSDEIVITVLRTDVDSIQAGLIGIKAKENRKLRAKGVPIDSSRFTFEIVEDADDKNLKDYECKLRISLIKRRSFNVRKIETPSGF